MHPITVAKLGMEEVRDKYQFFMRSLEPMIESVLSLRLKCLCRDQKAVAFLLRLFHSTRYLCLLSPKQASHSFLPSLLVFADEEILDLPACMIPKGVMENSRVSVAVVASIQDAATVNVEPLTCDDWELLETAAEFLEDGALLQQVSVLYSNQILPLWVGRKDVAWIRVLPDSFGQRTSVWPSGDNEPDDCCRLVRDTRVVVAPKTRRKNGPLSSPLLRVFPTRQDYSVATNKLAEWLGKMQVSLTPGTVVLNQATRHQIQGLGQEESAALVAVWDTANGSFSDDSSRSCILQVAFSDLVPPEHLGELLSACESEYQLLSRTINEDPTMLILKQTCCLITSIDSEMRIATCCDLRLLLICVAHYRFSPQLCIF